MTALEKRMLVATVVKIGVLCMMNTHVYSFAGDIYLQRSGGPIGLRSTCAVARVVMNAWDAKWMEVVKENKLEIKRRNRYMDDIRVMLLAIKQGWRWFMGRLCFTESWRKEDMEKEVSATRRTAKCLVQSMNEIYSFLRFTTEIGEDFVNGRLPSLDTEIWVEAGRRIRFAFYEKPMATNLVIQAKSALSEEVKLNC